MMTEEENRQIEDYLLDTISEEERAIIEKRISEDDRFRESLLLQKNIFESLDDSHRSDYRDFSPKSIAAYELLLKDDKTQQLRETLEAAYSTYKIEKKPKWVNWMKYAIAAAIVLLFTFKVLISSEISTQELYASNLDLTEIPSMIVRGSAETTAEKAQLYFEAGDYEKALPLFSSLSDTSTSNLATLLVYKGVSQMQLGFYNNASLTFDKLTRGDYLDASKGLWYQVLLSLKEDDKQKAQKYLEEIVQSEDNYNYTKAKELIDQL